MKTLHSLQGRALLILLLANFLWPAQSVFAQTSQQLPPPGSLAIVANKDNQERLSLATIKAIFLGQRTLWEKRNRAVTVILQPRSTAASRLFNQAFFADSGRRMSRQWIKNVVTGAAPAPETVKHSSDVLSAVRDNPEAIGYVRISASPANQDFSGIRIVVFFPRREVP